MSRASICRYLLATALVILAILKVLLLTDPEETAVLRLRVGIPATVAAAVLEGGLALWLVVRRRSTLPVHAVILFVVIVTAFAMLNEVRDPGWVMSCGCFGRWRLRIAEHLAASGGLIILSGLALSPHHALLGRRDR